MSTIESYLLNVFNGARTILGLMQDHSIAKEQFHDVKEHYSYFSYPGLGYKTYNARQLIDLWNRAEVSNLNDVIMIYRNSNLPDKIRLDAAVSILIIKRNELTAPIQGVKESRQMRTEGKRFTYLFSNPFPGYVKLDIDQKLFIDTDLINIWNSSSPNLFIPLVSY